MANDPFVALALTAGLSPGAKLRVNRIFRLTPTGIEWEGDETSEEQVRDLFKMLKWMSDDVLPLWLADAIGKAKQAGGNALVEKLLVEMEFGLDLAHKAMAIDTLERDIRDPFLTAQHYWALAHAEKKLTAEQQRKWAGLAVEHRLSAHLLVLSIAAGRVVTSAQNSLNSGRGSGLATPHGIRQAFDLWYGQVEFTKLDLDGKRQVYQELKPVADVVRQLEEELAALESEVEP